MCRSYYVVCVHRSMSTVTDGASSVMRALLRATEHAHVEGASSSWRLVLEWCQQQWQEDTDMTHAVTDRTDNRQQQKRQRACPTRREGR